MRRPVVAPRSRARLRAFVLALLTGAGLLALPGATASAGAAGAAAAAPAPTPYCTPGLYYAVTVDGTIGRAQMSGTPPTPPSTLTQVGVLGITRPWENGPASPTASSYGPANALGVAPDGTFYALQPRVVRATNAAQDRWLVDIYRMAPGATSGTRVATDYWYDSGRRTSTGEQKTFKTIGGAVHPSNGAYYFMNVQERPRDARFPAGWAIDVFEYKPASGVALRATIAMPAGSVVANGSMNGDIDFDDQGNFYFLFSGDGRSQLLSVSRERGEAAPRNGDPIAPSAVSETIETPAGMSYNGIAFDSTGAIVVQAANASTAVTSHRTFDPNTLRPISRLVQTNLDLGSDLASCQSPGTLRLEKEVVGRDLPEDQFRLSIHRITDGSESTTATATTSGTATGLQPDFAGPSPAFTGATYELREAATRSGGLADYTTTWRCANADTGATYSTGTGSTIRIASFPASTRLTCRFVNTPVERPIRVTKSVDPASGTAVSPGQLVRYTLGFDNTAGHRAAAVDHTDVLTGVLDDATLVPGSIDAQAPLRAALDGDRLRIGGSVPAGETRTVTYQVRVDRSADLGDRVLRNLVVPGDPTDPPCTPDTSCTENPVEDAAWTVGKRAEPTSGAEVRPGEVVTYLVDASVRRGVVPDAVLEDDLSDVLDSAAFVPGSASLTIDGGTPAAVPDPTGTTLRTAPFRLGAGQSARLRYQVRVDDDAWARTLRNVVTGDGASPPERCAPGGSTDGCTTEHPTSAPTLTLPATGGSGSEHLRLLGGALLVLGAAAGLARRRPHRA
ncbi:isopeptide-forming domain-containing fimbrial protein [Pimelobacter simplex]|uniref:isopeptide-forming domain-containing fimbrial protein n=1 Tax=Nocardioides simplex TaxID=2045 RepID=UPI003AADB830